MIIYGSNLSSHIIKFSGNRLKIRWWYIQLMDLPQIQEMAIEKKTDRCFVIERCEHSFPKAEQF
jgi:hypothetical protein